MAAQLAEIDDRVSVAAQMQQDEETGPIVLINTFTAAPEDAETLLAVWAEDAAFMKRQPGFIPAQMHRGIAGSTTFVNIAVWDSPQALRAAFFTPEFQAQMARYPDSTVTRPHLFQKVGVPGICVA
ncbi:MAG: antibiotic biosynthesis monooxygenase family protein [Thermomicrobiales bacterium]